jgi:PAS domain S-box-containing protein
MTRFTLTAAMVPAKALRIIKATVCAATEAGHGNRRNRLSWNRAKLNSPFITVIVVCFVALLSYLAPTVAGALLLHPQTVWPLWPGCALLVSVLLLVPRRIWPVVIPAAFAGFVLYDLQAGVGIGSMAWFIPADTVQVLIAAFCLNYLFDGVPRLNSVKALSKYLIFAVLLAPSVAAFLSAFGIHGAYWANWRICFLSEALAFVTLTPAILSWLSDGPAWMQKPRAYLLEFAALIAGLILLGCVAFTASQSSSGPALIYSLVPFLLWAAFRFGSTGVSISVIVVAFLSIWGAVHGRGPFTNGGPFSSVFSLQLFLVFAATPFMVLAALVEERKQVEEELRESEERLLLAVQARRMYVFEWDASTDLIVRTRESADIFNWIEDPTRATGAQFLDTIHPDDRKAYASLRADLTPDNCIYKTSYRVLRPDGSVIWLEANGRAFFDGQSAMLRIVGIVADVTGRKLAEEALAGVSRRLIEAQEKERTRIARELHDDISQRLALLTIELEQFRKRFFDLPAESLHSIGELKKKSSEIAHDVQSLSHGLHSSKLEYLGIVAAMRAFCHEYSDQQNVEVIFIHDEVPGTLPKEISLCLFRVLQEALQNATKHSGVRHFDTELRYAPDAIDLTVRDSGSGFDAQQAMKTRGLGLISMTERVKLVDGQLSIDSEPNRGTTIHARVPLNVRSCSMRVAG